MKHILKYLLLVVALLMSATTYAQEFNPDDPAEPSAPPISLVLKVTPAGAGSVSGAGKYAEGQSVTLRASSNTGFVFVSWTDEAGNILSTSTQYTHIKSAREEVITANYVFNPGDPSEPAEPNVPIMHYLTLEATDGGTVSGGGKYAEGASITVSASPNTGFVFKAWLNSNGDTISTSARFTYVMGKEDEKLKAYFEFSPSAPSEPSEPNILPKHHIYVSAGDGGTVSCSSSFAMEGTSITITAHANTGYKFIGWYSNETIVSNNYQYTFTLGTEDVSYIALFEFAPSAPSEPTMPDVSKNSLFLTTVSAKPGDIAECVVYFNTIKEEKGITFQLGFPKTTIPLVDSLVITSQIENLEGTAELINDSTVVLTVMGTKIPIGSIKLLTIDLKVPETFPVGLGNVITLSQVSVTNLDNTTETASTRNSSLDIYKFGDADNSGEIDIVDLTMARDYLYGIHIDGFEPIAVDLNRNNFVDDEDIKILMQLILDR